VRIHVIGNPVPTPEEMGEILVLSPDRVVAVRRIMDARNDQRASTRPVVASGAAARKKSSRTRTSTRAAAKR
jgi:hypothetical protein